MKNRRLLIVSPVSGSSIAANLRITLTALAAGFWAFGSITGSAAPLLSPSDVVIGIDLDSASGFPAAENPPKAVDGLSGTKYLNTSKLNAGIIVTPAASLAAKSMVLTTANDAVERDPASYVIFGSNQPITTTNNQSGFADHWTYIASGTLNLPLARQTAASPINIPNSTAYSSYWIVFTSTRDKNSTGGTVTNNLMQIADIQLYTESGGAGNAIFAPSNATVATGWNASWPSVNEGPSKVTDGTTSKYLNFGKNNSGFIVVPAAGATVVNSFVITTANDSEGRDPASYTLHGQSKDGLWTQISSGNLSLPAARLTASAPVVVANTTPYVAYRMVFPTIKNGGENSMQIAEVQLHGFIMPKNDTDSDGMDDGWEGTYGLTVGVDDSGGDLDSDGSNNLDEYRRGTLPNNADSDGDGLKDGAESNTGVFVSLSDTGTNPLKVDTDNDSYPDKYEVDAGTDPNASGSVPTLVWDVAPGTVGDGDFAITGGAGVWNMTHGNWTTDGGASNFAWDNNGQRKVAIFGGTEGGLVTLEDDIVADGVILNTTGYSFEGGNLTLGGPVPRITTGNAVSATISTPLLGTNGLVKDGPGTLYLTGSGNSLTGTVTLTGTGRLILNKSDGLAIEGNVNLSSTAWAGNNGGLVLAADEQIADTSILTWTTAGQAASFFRTNGHTETVAGLISLGDPGMVCIENRGYQDTASYPPATVIIQTAAGTSYSYNGMTRNQDQGPATGALGFIKTGPGTQILAGNMSHTGTTAVNDGVLQINGNLPGAPVVVSGTGTLNGTGTLGGAITVEAGGILSPGIEGVGTMTATGIVTIGSGGLLAGTGNFNGSVFIDAGGTLASTGNVSGSATVRAGGTLVSTGTIGGNLTVEAGAALSPGSTGVGILNANGAVALAGESTFDVDKTGGVVTSDAVNGFSSIRYGGTLKVNASGQALALGDRVQLFTPGAGGTMSGSFDSIQLPELGAGLSWDTGNLQTTGEINVVDYTGTPMFSPAGGGYIGAQSITITGDSGSTIYYTVDGSVPTAASPSGASPVSGIVIPLNGNVTVQAFAKKPGLGDSPLATATYRTVATATWVVDANGLWSDAANWLNEVSPNSSGAPVDFTLPQSGDTTVTLDGPRTAGSLNFANSNGFNWTVAPSGGAVLTLARAITPSVNVSDITATISAVIAGSQGLSKTGSGTLALTAANTFLGDVAVDGGTLSANVFAGNGNASSLGRGTSLTLKDATLRYTGGSVGYGGFNRSIALQGSNVTFDLAMTGFCFTTGTISGGESTSITKAGPNGQWIVQATNTYDGVTYLNEGEIQLRDASGLGSTVGNTIVANGARLCAGGALTGTISENVVLTGNGGGNGALQANDGGTIGNFAGTVTLAGDSAMGGGAPLNVTGVISGTGNLSKVSGNAATFGGSESNTYTGTTILGGTGKLVLAKTDGAIAIPGNIELSSTAWNGNNSGIVLAGNEQIADGAVLTWTTAALGGGVQQDSFLRTNGYSETIAGLVSAGNAGKAVVENRGLNDTAVYGTAVLTIQTPEGAAYSYNGSFRDSDGGTNGGTIAIVKTGLGKQTLAGGVFTAGAITVNAGVLELTNTVPNAPVTVNSGGTLGGNGSLGNTLTVASGGTVAPGTSTGILSAGATSLSGTYACELDGTSADRLTVTGDLTLGGTLAVSVLEAPTADEYVIASCTGTLSGSFASVTGLPSGYSLKVDTENKTVSLVKGAGYDAWAVAKGLTSENNGKAQDPDGDGVSNLVEYALGGNPLSVADKGTSSHGIKQVDGNAALTLTIAVRAGAAFAAGTNNTLEATVDGVTYRIEGSSDLASWTGNITEVTAITGDLPAAPEGYVYHTFRTAGPVALTAKDFIRVKVTETP